MGSDTKRATFAHRFISVLMSIVMVVGLMPSMAFADPATPTPADTPAASTQADEGTSSGTDGVAPQGDQTPTSDDASSGGGEAPAQDDQAAGTEGDTEADANQQSGEAAPQLATTPLDENGMVTAVTADRDSTDSKAEFLKTTATAHTITYVVEKKAAVFAQEDLVTITDEADESARAAAEVAEGEAVDTKQIPELTTEDPTQEVDKWVQYDEEDPTKVVAEYTTEELAELKPTEDITLAPTYKQVEPETQATPQAEEVTPEISPMSDEGIAPQSISGNLADLFNITAIPPTQNSNAYAPTVGTSTITFPGPSNYPKGCGGAATSKFSMDFSRSFTLSGSMVVPKSDGLGFALHTNPAKTSTGASYAVGMVDANYNGIGAGSNYDITGYNGWTARSQMSCGLLFNVFGTGSYINSLGSCAMHNGIFAYQMNLNNHNVFKSNTGALTNGYVWEGVPDQTSQDFKIQFACTNPSTGTGTLTVTLAGKTSTWTNFNASQVFNRNAAGGLDGNAFKSVYFSMSGWVPNDGTTGSLSFTEADYTDWPATHNSTTFWADRNGDGTYETQVNTTTSLAKPGETILVRHSITAKTSAADLTQPSRITKLVDNKGVKYSGSNPAGVKNPTGTPVTTSLTNNTNAYNTTSVSNSIGVPVYGGSAPTYFTYTMTAPSTNDTTVTEAAAFGQSPFVVVTSSDAQYKTATNNVFIGSTSGDKNSSGIAASDTNDGSSPSKPVATFAQAKSLLAPGGTIWFVGQVEVADSQTWDLNGYGTGGTGPGVLKRWDGKSVTFSDAKDKVANTSGAAAAVVPTGALTTSNIIIDGNNVEVNETNEKGALVSVMGSATLGKGTTLQNAVNKNANTAGVFVAKLDNTYVGILNIQDGATIKNCISKTTGAIALMGTATLNMTGGTIDGCYGVDTNSRGAVARYGIGTPVFNMSGGTITNTPASNPSAVDLTSMTMNMSGTAKVTDNASACGISVNTGTLNVKGTPQVTNNGPTTARSNVKLNANTKINVTGALGTDASIGVTVVAADHVNKHEFAIGSGYTTIAADAAEFSDDYNPAFNIEKTPDGDGTANTIRFVGWGVVYNGNTNTGGSVPTDANAYPYGTSGGATVAGNTGTLVKSGYTFAGWNTKDDGTGVSYAAGDTLNNATTSTTSITLYAKWTQNNDYAVAYNLNGATGTIANKTGLTFAATNLLPTTAPTRTGYAFAGWYTEATDGTKVENSTAYSELVANDTIKTATIYAHWTESSANVVHYNGNGATSSAIADKNNVKWTDTNLLPATAPTRTGFSFDGWYTADTGGTKVEATTAYSALDTAATGSTTLYAHWSEAANYTVEYDLNGATGTINDKTGVKFADTNLLPGTDPTRDGYTFAGWYTTAENGTQVTAATAYSALVADDTVTTATIYAHWTETTITATNVVITAATAKSATTDDARVIGLNKVSGTVNGTAATPTVTAKAPATSYADISAGTLGTYTITYQVGTGTAKKTTTATIKVVSDSTVVEPTTNTWVKATTVHLTSAQAKGVTSAAVLYGATYNNVSAAIDGVDVATPSMVLDQTITADDLAAIKAGTIGSYNVTYKATSVKDTTKSASKTVQVIVSDNGQLTDGVLCTSNDFVIAKGDVAGVADTKLVDLASAKGVNTAVSPEVALTATVNDKSALKAEKGVYPVKFQATANGKTAISTSNATVKDQVDVKDSTEISANDFTASIAEVTAGLASVAPDRSAVLCRLATTHAAVDYDADYSKVKPAAGVYPVTFTAKNGSGATVTVNCTVSDKTVTTDGVSISANNFLVKEAAAKTATADQVKTWAKAAASVVATGAAVTPVPDAANVAALNGKKAGETQDIKFTATDNGNTAEVTITATVIGDTAVVSTDTRNALDGKDITITQTTANGYADKAALLSAIDFKFFKDSTEVTDSDARTALLSDDDFDAVKTAVVTGAPKQVTLHFTYGEGDAKAYKEVVVTIVRDGSIIDPDTGSSVFAKDVTLKVSAAKAVADAAALKGSAYNNVSGVLKGSVATDFTQTFPETGKDFAGIKAGTVGKYPVKYQTTGSDAAITVNVFVVPDAAVVDPETNDSVDAQTVTITQTTAKALNSAADLYSADYNNVWGAKAGIAFADDTALKAGVSQSFAAADVFTSKIQAGVVGSYDVTYTNHATQTDTAKQAKKTVQVIVVPDGSVISPDKSAAAYAGVAIYKATDAKALTDKTVFYTAQNVSGVYNSAQIAADDLQTRMRQNLTASDWGSITAGTVGSYDSNYSVMNDESPATAVVTSTTGKVIVVADTAVVNGSNSVDGKNVVINVTTAKALANEKALFDTAYNNVSGYINGVAGTKDTLGQSFATGDWAAIKAGTLGTYTVTYSAGEGDTQASKDLTVTVVPDGSVVSGDDSIYSKTVLLKSTDAKTKLGSQTDSRVLMGADYNNVAATKGGQKIADPQASTDVTQEIVEADWDKIKAGTIGAYNVTYGCGTAEFQKVRVIIVNDNAKVDPDTNNAIYANSVTLTSTQAQAVASKKALYGEAYNDAVGVHRVTEEDLELIVGTAEQRAAKIAQTLDGGDFTKIQDGTTGTYPVTYTVTDQVDTSKTVAQEVNVTVLPDTAVINQASGAAVDAKPYIVTSSDAKNLTKAGLYDNPATQNKVIAVVDNKILSGTDRTDAITQTIATTDWDKIAAGTTGAYDVTYKVNKPGADDKDAASIKTQVIVVPDTAIIDPATLDAVDATTVTLTQTVAKSLSAATDLYGATNGNKVSAVAAGKPVGSGDLTTKVSQTFTDTNAWTKIKGGTIGTYDVEYAIGSVKTTGVKVVVVPDNSVVDPSTNDSVYASKVIITVDKAKALTDTTDLYGADYNAVGGNKAGVAITTGLTTEISQTKADGSSFATVFSTINAGTVGTYPVTYANVSYNDFDFTLAKTNVSVTVVPTGAVIDPAEGDAVYAKTKILTQSQAKTAFGPDTAKKTDLYAADYLAVDATKGNVHIADPAAGNDVTFSLSDADWASIKAGTVGSYDADVTCGTVSTSGVQVIITPDTVVVDPATNTWVGAQSVVLTPAQAKALADAGDLYGKNYNNVFGGIDGTAIAAGDITGKATQTFANTTDFTDIKAGKLGTYAVTYKTTSVADATKSASKKVNVIVSEKPVTTDGVIISASDFVISKADATAKVDATLIGLANATGLDTSVNPEVTAPVTVSDKSKLVGQVGVYPVEFTATNDADKTAVTTVNATVKDEVSKNNDGVEISANNYEMSVAEVTANKQAQVGPTRSAVLCRNQNTHEVLGYTADYSNILAKPGVYDVTYTSATDADVTVTVKCTVKANLVTTDGITIAANDVYVSRAQTAACADADAVKALIKNNAAASAKRVDTGAALDPTVNSTTTTYGDAATIGVFDATFGATYDDGTAHAATCGIKVHVTDKAVTDNGINVAGNNFLIKEAAAAAADEAAVLTASAAHAAVVATGASVTPTVPATEVTALNGKKAGQSQTITLTATDNGKTATAPVTATVIGDDAVVSTDGRNAIDGASIVIPLTTANGYADKAALVAALNVQLYKDGVRITDADTLNALVSDEKYKAVKEAKSDELIKVVPITLTTGTADAKVTKDISVTITPATVVVDPDTNTWVGAQSVVLTPAQAQALAAAGDLYGKNYNNVFGGIDGTAIAAGDITGKATQTFDNANDFADINAGKLGTYAVTYKTTSVADNTKSASKKVNVIVSEKPVTTDGVIISASDFVISKADAKAKVEATLIGLANATGLDTSVNPEVAATVTVTDDSKLVDQVGVYPVEFTATNDADKTAKTTVNATVKDEVSKNNNGVEISANDYEMSVAEVTDGKQIEVGPTRSAVLCRNQNTHEVLGYTANYSNIKPAPGVYDVVFTSNDDPDVTITVKCTVKANLVTTDGITIAGNTVYLTVATAKAATADTIKTTVLGGAAATAKRTDTGAALTPTCESTTTPIGDNAAVGTYKATLKATYNDGTKDHSATCDIDVVVTDTSVTTDGINVSGNNFLIKEAAAAAADEAAVLTASAAHAAVVATGAPVTPTVPATEVTALNGKKAGQTQTITLTATDNGKTATAPVTATVIGDDAVVSTDGRNAIEGTSIVIPLATANGYADKAALVAATNMSLYANGLAADATTLISDEDFEAIQKATFAELVKVVTLNLSYGKDKAAVSKTITVTITPNSVIVDPTTNTYIGASTVYLSAAQAKLVADKNALYGKNYNKVFAGIDGELVKDADLTGKVTQAFTNADDFANIQAGKKGAYDVTYSTTSVVDPTKTVTTTGVQVIVSDKTGTSEDGNIQIGGNDFTVAAADVAGMDDAAILSAATAGASRLDPPLDLTASIKITDKGGFTGVAGVYPITLTVADPDDATKTATVVVNATVKDKVVVDPATGETITANDFVIGKQQVIANLDDTYLNLAQAEAHKTDTGENVTITTIDRASVKPVAGTYPVTFATKDGTTTTVNATVVDNLVISPDGKYAIWANDFMEPVAEAGAPLNNDYAKLVANASAYAKDLTTGAVLPVTTATAETVAAAGKYPGHYTYSAAAKSREIVAAADGVSTVSVDNVITVLDKVVPDTKTGETIGANNFFMSIPEVGTFADPDYVARAMAKAYVTATHAPVDITTVDASAVKPMRGVYPVTFTTTTGTTVTVNATVVDTTVVNPDPAVHEAIGGNNFTVKSSEVAGLTPEKLIELGAAAAYNTETGEAVAITKIDSTAVKEQPGVYPVIYTTDAGTTMTLFATVLGDKSVVNEANGEMIDANDFTVKASEVAGLTNDKIIELAGAQAWSILDGKVVAVAVKQSAIQAKAGQYEVTFTTDKGTQITVICTVVDDGTPTPTPTPVTPTTAKAVAAVKTAKTADTMPMVPLALAVLGAAGIAGLAARRKKEDAK